MATTSLAEARKAAWVTRRAKYGPQGHAGRYTRFVFDPIGTKALALVMLIHEQGILSEGQCCKALDLDRITFRIMRDGHAAAREQRIHSSPPSSEGDRSRDEQSLPSDRTEETPEVKL